MTLVSSEQQLANHSAVAPLRGEQRTAEITQAWPERPLRVAYIMSRFPKITETFILFEMLSAERLGAAVEVYPLWRERTRVMHEEARAYVARAHFLYLFSWAVLIANLKWLVRRPRRYWGALGTGLRANWGSRRYFVGFLAAFPKAIAMGDDMLQRRVQHVHAHFASHPAAAAYVIHRVFDVPFSFTAHGSDLHRDRHMLREKVQASAFAVAISKYNRNVMVDTCGAVAESRVVVIHCGADTRVFRPGLGKRSSNSAAVQITCVGTLHEVKGQGPLIEACARLRDQGVAFHLHFVGDGPDENMLRHKVAQLALGDRVRFHGRRTRSEVAEQLAQSDLVVAPSVPTQDGRREGIPVALMEAMACGVPVVASRISGIPELIEDDVNGRLVPAGDVTALAEALAELANAAETRARLGSAARQTIEQRFDQQTNAARLLQHIGSCLAQRRQAENAR